MVTSSRVKIARFESLLEAEAAKSLLEANAIECFVDNSFAGTIMPHASNALGGFTLQVDLKDEKDARELLAHAEEFKSEPLDSEETQAQAQREVEQILKRACYGALFGLFFLPLIVNFFSYRLLKKAKSKNSKVYYQHKWLRLVTVLLNFISIFWTMALFYYFLKEKFHLS